MINLIQGDCLDLMQEIPGGSVDMVLTSPPYDNLRDYNKSLVWNQTIWESVIRQLYRVIKEGGLCVWIVSDATVNGSETGTSFKQALFAKSIGFRLYDTMIWDKGSSGAIGRINGYVDVFDYMFILSKGKPNKENTIRDKKNKRYGERKHPSCRDRDGVVRKSYNSIKVINQLGKRHNIWRIDPCKKKSERLHPAPFPVNLANDHVISWSNPSDIVLDPFMGSGTVGIACKNLGREFIGIEKDPDYFELAKNRINQHQAKQELGID